MKKKKEESSERSVNTKNLKSSTMDAFESVSDPSQIQLVTDELQPLYLEAIKESQKSSYFASSGEEKFEMLLEFAKDSLAPIILDLRLKGKEEMIESLELLAKEKKFKLLFVAIDQLREDQREAAPRRGNPG